MASTIQPRLDYTRSLIENALQNQAPTMNKNLGVESQQKGIAALEQLMQPYQGYWGGGQLASEKTASSLADKLTNNFMNLQKAKALASGRSYDIQNLGQQREDLYNTYQTKKNMARGLSNLEEDIAFQSGEKEKERQSTIQTVKDRIAAQKEAAKKAQSAAKTAAQNNAWVNFFSMLPGLAVGLGTGSPAAGMAAYTGAKNIGGLWT